MNKIGWNFKKDKLNNQEKLEFLEYLNNCLANGFSLNNSIELLIALWPAKKALMQDFNQRMKNGAKFSEELRRLGFAPTVIIQIQLAMEQGNLNECLNQLAILHRLKNQQIKKIGVELSYPIVLAGMMIALLIFMQTFVSSQFENSQEYSGDFLLMGIVLLIFFLVYQFLKILTFLAKQDYMSLKKLSKYAIFGKAIKTYISYLLVYDIGLLLASGFSLQKMCEYAAAQADGSLQQHLGKKISNKLKAGENLNQIIKEEIFLPDALLLLLKGGAKRSNLSKQCLILGKSLFLDLTRQIEKMVVGIQPFCFILLGLCIIGMYLKLLLPMYAMMQGI